VTVVTPAVYQALAERGLGPQLIPPVRRARLPARYQLARTLFRNTFATELAPKSVPRLAKEGGTGVPLFERDELPAFLAEAEDGSPESPRHGQWWEFWPTTDGGYAMFPGDDEHQPSVATSLWIPSDGSARVRRVTVSPLARKASGISRPRSDAAPEPCELVATESQPGAPYVGRCSTVRCDSGCSPHVVVQPDDGIYRLMGCDC
jgi:hypothetical protein